MSTTSANASDVGLIVQGTLIFLSACIGVLGFLVKGRLERKQKVRDSNLQINRHLSELKLIRIRQQQAIFLGPASMHTMELWSAFWSVVPGTLNKMSNGKVNEYFNTIDFSFQTFMKGQFCEMESWVGPVVEKEMSENPKGELAVTYCSFMRRMILKCAVPFAELIQQHGGHLSQFPTPEDFKTRFPCSAKDGWLRNSYYLQTMNWTHEFCDILNEWEKGNFTVMFPKLSKYPCQITPFILMQITALREQETKLGAANHKVQSWDVEKAKYKDTEMVEGKLILEGKASKEKEVQEVKKKANKKSKYAAAAGAVAGAAVVGALS